jgi:hypothetical protein
MEVSPSPLRPLAVVPPEEDRGYRRVAPAHLCQCSKHRCGGMPRLGSVIKRSVGTWRLRLVSSWPRGPRRRDRRPSDLHSKVWAHHPGQHAGSLPVHHRGFALSGGSSLRCRDPVQQVQAITVPTSELLPRAAWPDPTAALDGFPDVQVLADELFTGARAWRLTTSRPSARGPHRRHHPTAAAWPGRSVERLT